MRHVLGVPSSRRALYLIEPAYSSHQPSILISRNRSVSSFGLEPLARASPATYTTVDSTQFKPFERSKSTTTTDAVPLADQEQVPYRYPASVRRPYTRGTPAISNRSWTTLDPTYSPESFNQRNRERDRDPGRSRMLCYIQFITTPTSDTPGTALILHFDDKRYIIGNVHEGLQRACLEMKVRALHAKDIFITGRTEWRSVGGLLGMILTFADQSIASAASKAGTLRLRAERRVMRQSEEEQRREKNPKSKSIADGSSSQATHTIAESQSGEEDPTMRLHGGPNLSHTLATARSFIFRKGMPVNVFEHGGERKDVKDTDEDWEPTWSDKRVQVWAMPIRPSDVSEVSEDLKPESPRKRGLGEFMTGKRPTRLDVLDQWMDTSAPSDVQVEQDQKIRELAITQMFSSLWSRDNLIETPLRNVKTPAALYVRDPVTKEFTRYEGPMPDGTSPLPEINVWVREAWPGASINHLPPAKRSSTAMSYIIRSQKMRGKFDAAAAREKNVPSGPLWSALASGSSVWSTDGSLVTPEMVIGPSKEGNGVAVIDLPSREYVHDLVSRPEWRAAKVTDGVVAIIWILGPGVVQDKTLLKFIEGQSKVQHIFSSPEHCPDYLSMTSAACTAIRLHQIDPARYVIPVHNNAVPSEPDELSDAGKTAPEDSDRAFRPAKRGLTIKLQPKFSITEDAIVPFLNTAQIVRETSGDVLDLSQSARQEISASAVHGEALDQNLPSPDAEIVCLGTGSALPSQHRNVSATLLRVPGSGSYLMDCGENTLGQLKRMYTAPELAEVFRDLKLIWISHLHADHHLGLTSVVKAWYQEVHGKDEVKRPRPTLSEQTLDPGRFLKDDRRLFIVGNGPMIKWLEEYSSVEDFGYDQLVPLVSLPAKISDGVKASSDLEWNDTNVGFSASIKTYVHLPYHSLSLKQVLIDPIQRI